MVRKSQLTEENKKLKRKLFIWENINISINSSVKEKGIIADKKTVLKIMRTNNLVKENVIKRKTPKVDKEKRNYYRNLLKQQFGDFDIQRRI